MPHFKVKKKVGYMQDKNHARLKDRTGSYEGFFVDIVAFMGMKNKHAHRRILFKNQIRMVFYFISDFFFNHDPKGMKKRIKKEEEKYANAYKDAEYVCQSAVLPFQIQRVNLYPKEVIYPFKEYTFNGVKLYSFNDVEKFCLIRYGKNCLKKEVNGEMIDPWPKGKRTALHINKFKLPE